MKTIDGSGFTSGHGLLFIAVAAAVLNASVCARLAAQPAPAADTKAKWDSSALAGLTLTRGNSDTVLGTANILTGRKWDQNELSFGVDGTYGETKLPGATNTTKNAESAHGFGQYNRLLNERLYGFTRADALHDAIADIEYRVTLSVGAGYYFVKTTNTLLSAEIGPGYVFEKLGSAEDSYATLRVGEKFFQQLSSRSRLHQSLEFLPEFSDFSNYVVNGEVGVEADITIHLSLNTILQDTYRSHPATGRKKNDLKLIAGVKYKF